MVDTPKKVIIADGSITLFLRDENKDPRWQASIKLPNQKQVVQRSTGERDLQRAKHVALAILGELNQRIAQNLPLRTKTFGEVAGYYLNEAETLFLEGRKSVGRFDIVRGTLRRYLLPYFGRKDIVAIHRKDLMEYRAWRQAYWVTGPGKGKGTKRSLNPTQASFKSSFCMLSSVNIFFRRRFSSSTTFI